ncbi:MAG: hypothetical protein HYT77_00625 [Deltaproteobacteria bacterium]|nr:hypothetical protein [Deltaproteobacteria bacterium]
MTSPVTYAGRFQAILGRPPKDDYEEGAAQCMAMIDQARAGTIKWGDIEKKAVGVEEERLLKDKPEQYRWGFAKGCRWAGPYLNNSKAPVPDTEIESALRRISAGYFPYQFLLRKFGIDPVEADKSTLDDPKTFLIKTPRPGGRRKTGHLFMVVPASIDEAGRILVLQPEKMKERTPLCIQSDVIDKAISPPNLDGSPFWIRQGFDLPWPFDDRYFTVKVKALKWGRHGEPYEGMRVDMSYVNGSGNINAFEATARVWRIDPERFVLYFRSYADFDVNLPLDFLQDAQTKKLAEFVEKLMAELKK